MEETFVTIARVHLHHAGHFVIAQVSERPAGAPQEVRFLLEVPGEERPRRIAEGHAALLVQMTGVACPPYTPPDVPKQ